MHAFSRSTSRFVVRRSPCYTNVSILLLHIKMQLAVVTVYSNRLFDSADEVLIISIRIDYGI